MICIGNHMLLSAIIPKLHEKACNCLLIMTLEEQWPRSKKSALFSRANISQRKFHPIFGSQTFLSEKTQVLWLNKILLKTCFHGYRACSVSRSAINTSSAIRD